MPCALVTGANRGLGLEYSRQLVAAGWQLIACAREPARAAELAALRDRHPDRVQLEALDVTDHEAVATLARRLEGTAIDLLLNNAGSFGPAGAPAGMAYQGLAHMDYGIWREILEINLLAPFHMAVSFRPHLQRAARPLLVMVSSDLGSVAQNRQGQSYAYRSSKAGLNMLARGMAAEWADIIVVAVAPGWCRTDLGGAEALLDPADSVADQLQTFARLTTADSGRFIDRHGDTVPW